MNKHCRDREMILFCSDYCDSPKIVYNVIFDNIVCIVIFILFFGQM